MYLDLKARISSYCRICALCHFYLNQDEEWQDKYRHLTVLQFFNKHIEIRGYAQYAQGNTKYWLKICL